MGRCYLTAAALVILGASLAGSFPLEARASGVILAVTVLGVIAGYRPRRPLR